MIALNIVLITAVVVGIDTLAWAVAADRRRPSGPQAARGLQVRGTAAPRTWTMPRDLRTELDGPIPARGAGVRGVPWRPARETRTWLGRLAAPGAASF